jgi:putative endopeptidase
MVRHLDFRNRSMKRLLMCAAAASAALWASTAIGAAADEAARYGAWGFDASAMDAAVSPGDDFYRYAQGKALDTLKIPADRSSYGSFDVLAELSDVRGRAVIEKAAADANASGEEAKVGAFYRAFMDEKTVERLDMAPMSRELAAVKAARTRSAIARLMGRANLGFGSTFFAPGIEEDAKDPDHYAVHLFQAGLGLPDRDYYLKPDFAAKKALYQSYIAQMLTMMKWPDPKGQASAIVALESQIADASWDKVARRQADKTYNPMSLDDLAKAAPGFDWRSFMAGAELGGVDRVVVNENTAFPKIAAIFAKTPIRTLQAWLTFNIADQAAPYLPQRFVEARFTFRNKGLYGQQQIRPRWKRGVLIVGDQLGEAVGKLYVAAYFPPESKAKMEALVQGLRDAMAARIQKVSWMSPETKAKALEKLSKFRVKIGYPDKWRDYSALRITAGDLYGDVERSTAFDWERQVKRLGGPVDKTEWDLTPQTVNAYYNPLGNEIVFPAAILQPPFFDPSADMAVNYGAIGAVIGHETTHGFDDQGRKYDGTGRLADWWTADDAASFQAEAKKLGVLYSAFEALPGQHVNGDLTMGENIADLGGMLMALDAYHASLGGKPAPVIDGLTGDQRFFLAFAQIYRSKRREDYSKMLLVADPHSPDNARVDVVTRNVDAWYDAFDVKPGAKAYLPPEQRARIW